MEISLQGKGRVMEFTLLLVSLLLFSLSLSVSSAVGSANQTDHSALLSFKDGIADDPSGVTTSWNQSVHFCHWNGVTCGSIHPQRVTSLDLSSRNLAGFISPSIGNLTFLRNLLLMDNRLYGEIPPGIGSLRRLQHLNLSMNSLQGEIPANLSRCSDIRIIDLGSNLLVGSIPSGLGSLSKLDTLGFFRNNITGFIPPALGNLSSLTRLSFSANLLRGGIPPEFGRLVKLSFLHMGDNFLSGVVPLSLLNLSSLYYFNAAFNELQGSLPASMGNALLNLQYILIAGNHFTGRLPVSLPNATRLLYIDAPSNKFSGRVPSDLGKMQGLVYLNLNLNQLEAGDAEGWKFFTSLTNCSNLVQLHLAANNLGGVLPGSIANLSSLLQQIAMQSNKMYGTIPSEIGNLESLAVLALYDNLISGTIPKSIGQLSRLQWLGLYTNRLSGRIPSSLGNLTALNYVGLAHNYLEGSIPSSLGNLQKVTTLDLSDNNLNGTIPKEIVSLSSLAYVFSLADNSLEGSLPSEVGSLRNLEAMYLSGNKISGEIPAALGGCQILEYLTLDNNYFQGAIPSALGNIKGLRQLNLSKNNLHGSVPDFLGNLKLLEDLDLSFNDFEGEVPIKGVFENASAVSLVGNSRLCGGIQELHFPACANQTPAAKGRSSSLRKRIAIPLAIAVILFSISVLSSIAYFHCGKKGSNRASPLASSLEDQHPRVSYAELAKATNDFSSENLIGMGRFGSVYKGTLHNIDVPVAVKVFHLSELGASKSFIAECEALRSIRHRNLIKILTSCSTIDSRGNDFKALVFEFMSNGNLEIWLHAEEMTKHLSLLQRLNVAVDVADALDYLHHNCEPPIVHCDLKPSNILLDDGMTARVGDFGLARLLPEAVSKSFQESSGAIGAGGTIGYIPPEYGTAGQVSTTWDVYSYGILIMEMFTRRRPVSDIFRDGVSLFKFVEMAVPGRVMEIVDPILRLEAEHISSANASQIEVNMCTRHECLLSVMRISLSCSNPHPNERMSMRDVAKEMHAIRDAYLADQNLSPR